MWADYDYYAKVPVHTVTYGNDPVTEYSYDDAGRVWIIDHRNEFGLSRLKLTYTYDGRDLPVWISEEEQGMQTTHVQFSYDDRGRLIGESRIGNAAYDVRH